MLRAAPYLTPKVQSRLAQVQMSSDKDDKVFKTEHGTVISRPDGTATFETPHGSGTLHADGTATLKAHGATVETGEDGIRLNLDRIEKIAIDNITDVQSHTIQHGTTARSHHIVFLGGGEVRISYRLADGKLLEFRGTDLSVGVIPEGVVTLSKAKPQRLLAPSSARQVRCTGGNARNDVGHVVMAARGMVDCILTAARRSAFQRRELIDWTPDI